MALMEKINCGVIYAVKMNQAGNWYDSIASFMSKYTDTPITHYSHSMLETILSRAIADLLDNLKRPSSFWFEYWRCKKVWDYSDFDAMCASLATVQVKDLQSDGAYIYINGFRPFEEFKL